MPIHVSQIVLSHADTGTYDEPPQPSSARNPRSLYLRSRRERLNQFHNQFHAFASSSAYGGIVGEKIAQRPLEKDFIAKNFRIPLTARLPSAPPKRGKPLPIFKSLVSQNHLPRGRSTYTQEFALHPDLQAIARRFNNPQQHRVTSARVRRTLGIGLSGDSEPVDEDLVRKIAAIPPKPPNRAHLIATGFGKRPSSPAASSNSTAVCGSSRPPKLTPEERFLETGLREKKMLEDFIARLEATASQPLRIPAPPRVPFPC